jgi:hypothetical protein
MTKTLSKYSADFIVDLNTVRLRIKEQYSDWDIPRLDKAEHEYRRFLALCKRYPEEKICPSPDVDTMWHMHILDTRKYAEDCRLFFGHFLHHEACIGERDHVSMAKTIRLYESVFGGKPDKQWQEAVMTCANPGGGCGSAPSAITV